MKKKTAISPEDSALFRAAIGEVQRLRHNASEDGAPKPQPLPSQTLADRRAVMETLRATPAGRMGLEQAEPLGYLKDGIDPRILRKLGKGEYRVRDEIDLHAMTAKVAEQAVRLFLAEARAQRFSCVKIIHGKGRRSKEDGPVLKRMVDKLLRQRSDVLAFHSARGSEGGSGAVVVLLSVG